MSRSVQHMKMLAVYPSLRWLFGFSLEDSSQSWFWALMRISAARPLIHQCYAHFWNSECSRSSRSSNESLRCVIMSRLAIDCPLVVPEVSVIMLERFESLFDCSVGVSKCTIDGRCHISNWIMSYIQINLLDIVSRASWSVGSFP